MLILIKAQDGFTVWVNAIVWTLICSLVWNKRKKKICTPIQHTQFSITHIAHMVALCHKPTLGYLQIKILVINIQDLNSLHH